MSEYIDQMRQYLVDAGLDPDTALIGAAQAALETGHGQHVPDNNHFGIKGPGRTFKTKEQVGDSLVTQNASFRGYDSPQASAQDYADFIRKYKRYAPVINAPTINEKITAMGNSGYATDKYYGDKLRGVLKSYINADPQQASVGRSVDRWGQGIFQSAGETGTSTGPQQAIVRPLEGWSDRGMPTQTAQREEMPLPNDAQDKQTPPGYGNMGMVKAGLAGMTNPFEDMSGYAQQALPGLLSMLTQLSRRG